MYSQKSNTVLEALLEGDNMTKKTQIAVTEEGKIDFSDIKADIFKRVKGQKLNLVDGKSFIQNLVKSAVEALLDAEMEYHLSEEQAEDELESKNTRNGKSKKSVRSEYGELEITTPRDRQGTFEPQIIKKYQRDFIGFSDKIISLYARGMSTREISEHLKEIYGVEVSAEFISQTTAKIQEEVTEWQRRPLEKVYTIVYMDCIRCKVKDDNAASIQNKAIYLAYGITMEGTYDVLGIWVSNNEGAKFWMSVLNEIRSRGVEDILIACVDGLTGFPDAINSIYPDTDVQLCAVHMVRNSVKYIPYKDMKDFCNDLKGLYGSINEAAAEDALKALKDKWQDKYSAAIRIWEINWDKIINLYKYPTELRTMVYTTNTIEGLNRQLRKNIKNRGVFPNDDSLIRLLYLNIKKILAKKVARRNWSMVRNQLAVLYPDRVG